MLYLMDLFDHMQFKQESIKGRFWEVQIKTIEMLKN